MSCFPISDVVSSRISDCGLLASLESIASPLVWYLSYTASVNGVHISFSVFFTVFPLYIVRLGVADYGCKSTVNKANDVTGMSQITTIHNNAQHTSHRSYV